MSTQTVSAAAAAKPAPTLITTGSIPGTSARLVNSPPKRRLIVSVEAQEGRGKTHFSLTAPGPIAIQNIDVGLEGVVDKFQSEKEIHEASYTLGLPLKKDECAKIYQQYLNDYKAFIASDRIKTIIHDTSSEAWDIIRMARLGKLVQVMPHNYLEANADFRELIRLAYTGEKNLVLIHKQKKQYVNEQFTGKYERAGFGDVGFLVQVVVEMAKQADGRFKLTVRKCRQNTSLEGKELVGDDCNFISLAKAVYPASTAEQWLKAA